MNYTMKTLYTWKNKEAEKWVDRYWKSHDTKLWQVYKKWSCAKEVAYQDCCYKMYQEGGKDFRILSATNFFFTCGWRTKFGDYRIETPTKSLLIIDLPF